jgi:hypothetical protein
MVEKSIKQLENTGVLFTAQPHVAVNRILGTILESSISGLICKFHRLPNAPKSAFYGHPRLCQNIPKLLTSSKKT